MLVLKKFVQKFLFYKIGSEKLVLTSCEEKVRHHFSKDEG